MSEREYQVRITVGGVDYTSPTCRSEAEARALKNATASEAEGDVDPEVERV